MSASKLCMLSFSATSLYALRGSDQLFGIIVGAAGLDTRSGDYSGFGTAQGARQRRGHLKAPGQRQAPGGRGQRKAPAGEVGSARRQAAGDSARRHVKRDSARRRWRGTALGARRRKIAHSAGW
eukprot:6178784-Pleurochrysis_carterae.AAC.2